MGMVGIYSYIPLKALIDAGANVVGVVFSRPTDKEGGPKFLPAVKSIQSELPLRSESNPENILTAAGRHDIPVLSVGNLKDETSLQAFRDLKPELVITVCFPQILPKSWLGVPAEGCLNLHPSLLPAYRGPNPLFWQFREGEKNTGVTLHFMDAVADAGDIVAQKSVEFPKGITAFEADQVAAKAGAELILETISMKDIPRRSQHLGSITYQAAPTREDRFIREDWEVKRAFNFLRGADEWAPFWFKSTAGEELEISQVLSYQVGKKNAAVIIETAAGFEIQLSDGVLLVK